MKKDFINCAKLVRTTVQAMPNGQTFNGWELKKLCVKQNPKLKNTYVDTFLREMRASCRQQVVCINRRESLYQKIGATNE